MKTTHFHECRISIGLISLERVSRFTRAIALVSILLVFQIFIFITKILAFVQRSIYLDDTVKMQRKENAINLIMQKMTTSQEIISKFYENLKCKKKVEEITRLFVKIPPNEKVAFVYSLLEAEDLLPNFANTSSKSAEESFEYRCLGNKAFCSKKDASALKYYTKSVSLALSNTEELSVAYANRSAVLFKLSRYDLCLLDIDRALSGKYPDSLKYKLLDRKGKCFLEIGDEEKAKRYFLVSMPRGS